MFKRVPKPITSPYIHYILSLAGPIPELAQTGPRGNFFSYIFILSILSCNVSGSPACPPSHEGPPLPQPQWYQAFPIQTTLKISSYSGEAPSFLGRIEAANFISFHRLPEGFPPTWSYGGTGQQNISSSFQWQTQSLRPGCPSLCIWGSLESPRLEKTHQDWDWGKQLLMLYLGADNANHRQT